MRTHDEELGVSKTSSLEEIKKAYRTAALTFHPDKNPVNKAAEDRFKALANAYGILGDPKKRKMYDEDLLGRPPGGFPEHSNMGSGGVQGEELSVEEILRRFGAMFGGEFGEHLHRERGAGRPGHDIEVEIHVDFRTATLGLKMTVSLTGAVTCEECKGLGAQGEHSECPDCAGSGRVTAQTREKGKFFTVTRACHPCRGTGIDPNKGCAECHGSGVVERTRSLNLTLPVGAVDGVILRLAGLGGAGTAGAPPGDLLVHVNVRPDPVFQREGDEIFSDLRVSMIVAALGGKVPIETLHGRVQLAIPPGTSTGTKLRMRGQGLRGAAHVANIQVTVPAVLNGKQRALLMEFKDVPV